MPRRRPRERSGRGSDWTMPESWCPACLHRFNGAGSPFHDTPPRPGDYSVCIECAEILTFDANLKTVLPDPIVLAAELAADPELRAVLTKAVRTVKDIHETGGLPHKRRPDG